MGGCAEQGLVAGIHRQFIFTGLRLGLYTQVTLGTRSPAAHALESVLPIAVALWSLTVKSGQLMSPLHLAAYQAAMSWLERSVYSPNISPWTRSSI